MHVTLVSPFSVGPTRGNITTVRRIASYLPETGCRVAMLPLDALSTPEQAQLLSRNRPDLLHAFHAYHSGPTTRRLARLLGVPYLLTITGSDLFDPAMNGDGATRRAIADAAAVTCFDPLVARCLKDVFPEAPGKLAVIPQGVAPLPVRESSLHAGEDFLILLPAALRPVKGISSALDALTPLAEEFPRLRLLLAGGDLDPEYSAMIRGRVARLPWVQLLGEVPCQRMGALYAAADLVLNCSLFEGGMANSLLEAMSMGRPILARDVPGNRALVRQGKTGWLYESDDELRDLVRLVILDPEQGRRVGEAGRIHVGRRCSPSLEARRYASLYERVIRSTP
jgi:glycosyltransferase involved in cell wall biosynthesis